MDVNMSDIDRILWNLDHGLPEDMQDFWKVDNNNNLSLNPSTGDNCKPINNTISPSVLEVQGSNNHMDFTIQNNEIREEINHTDCTIQNNEIPEILGLDIHVSLAEMQSM